MKNRLNATHDPALVSWVASANRRGGDFPIQNLPFGAFQRGGQPARVGVAIGDRILDVSALLAAGLLSGQAAKGGSVCGEPSLNRLMALGRPVWSALRKRLSELLSEANPEIRARAGLADSALVPMEDARMLLPSQIGDYTDFYASLNHATNVGRMFRPEQPLLPNYKHVPIGYHGRASSIVPSDMPVRRPSGQRKDEGAPGPEFGPTRVLDYEAEAGFFVGPGNALGEPIPMAEAEDHIFGLCLVNDWSARDLQKWEYQPLGPFLGKSFATSISPWVVTLEALEPFRVPAWARPEGDPRPLAYLDLDADRERGGIDLTLEVSLSTPRMRERGVMPFRLSRGRLKDLYWTPAQMLAHHASNGCNLRPGDLLASGTVSGSARDELGCLLEMTRQGKEPVALPGGEERRFLLDGDEVILSGYCSAEGFVGIGLGQCVGRVWAAAGS